MGFPVITSLATGDYVSIARIPSGNTLPVAYTIDSDSPAAAGATSLTLSLTTVAGAGASGSDILELEHDQEIWFPANSSLNVDGAGVAGSFNLSIDDGADGLPTNLIAVGDYFTVDGDAQKYLVVDRTAGAAEYTVRVFPALKSAPVDNAAVTVYNLVKVNLPSDTQFVNIVSTGASVPVTGCTYAMDGTTTSLDVYEMRRLLGAANISVSPTVNSTDVVDMLGSVTLPGSTGAEISVEGNRFPKNAGYSLMQLLLLDPDYVSDGVYVEAVSSEGDRYRDIAAITDGSGSRAADNAGTYSATLSLTKGDNFSQWLA